MFIKVDRNQSSCRKKTRNLLRISVSAPLASPRRYFALTQRQRIEQETKDKQIIHIQLVKAEKTKEEREIKASTKTKQQKVYQPPHESKEVKPVSDFKQ